MGPVGRRDIPKLIEGYDTVINDATYFNEDTLKRCTGLKHIVFLGTGAASFVDLAAAAKARHQGLDHLGLRRHRRWPSMPWAWCSPPPATSPPCMPSCAAAAGGRCRAWSCAARRWASWASAASAARWRASPSGIGLKVVAWNRSPRADAKVPMVDIDELLEQSDIVSLHLGLNDQTKGFLDRAKLQKAKKGVIVVNTARAGVVDEPALIDLLKSGHVGHYATDVFAKEPVDPERAAAQARQRHADGARRLQHARGGDDHVSPRHRPGEGRLTWISHLDPHDLICVSHHDCCFPPPGLPRKTGEVNASLYSFRFTFLPTSIHWLTRALVCAWCSSGVPAMV